MIILNLLLTLLAAIIGALIAKKIKLPAPFMLGAMLGVAIFNVFTARGSMPSGVKFFTQSLSAIFIALSITKKDLANMKYLLRPGIILVGGFMIFTMTVGLILNRIFKFDIATSFLLCIPGGIVETSLMAYDFGADSSIVSFVQSFRLFTVYAAFPLIISAVSKKVKDSDAEEMVMVDEKKKDVYPLDKLIPDNDWVKKIATVIVALIGGYIGKVSGLPAGVLSIAMIAVIIFNFNSHRALFPRDYKKYVQIVAGSLIGSGIGMDTMIKLPSLILPTIVLMACYIGFNFIASFLMSRTKKIGFISSMFASSPGGASDMALIASELGGESPKIAILQVLRLISVYTIFPFWVKFLIAIFK